VTEILESNREAIIDACRRHGVARLHAFGSALRGDFEPASSDVDLLVEFGSMEAYARVDAYFGLLDELRTITGQDVDLVVAGAVKNRYIADDIEHTKQMLYAA
jgi:predicted nucleotidyltransferase